MRLEIGERVGGETTFYEDGVGGVGVYIGLMTNLTKVNVTWTPLGDQPGFSKITLDEIADQVGRQGVIHVIEDNPLNGNIYTYGNHGDFWEKTGELIGYA